MVAYPNPTRDFVNLKVEQPTGLEYLLIDMSGRVLRTESLSDESTIIGFHNLRPNIYFINVMDGLKVLQTFKVIKK